MPLRPSDAPRLLYIEDNEVNVLIMIELLRARADLALQCATDGRSGLALARAQPPALALIDLHLPDMHGAEVLRELRAAPATAQVRCVALSSDTHPAVIADALQAGFDDYWTKPIDFEQFNAHLSAQFGPPPAR